METRKLITVSLPPPLLAAAEELAARERRTRSELVREALRQYIETSEARREAARESLRKIVARIHKRTQHEDPRKMRALITEAITAVRAEAKRRT